MDNQPPAVPAVQKSGLATASLVLGIIAVIPCVGIPFAIFGIAALICGIMAYSKIKAAGGLMLGKGQATAGIVMGSVSVAISSVFLLVMLIPAMTLPALSTAREKARTASCVSNMKALSTVITMYADDNGEGLMPATLEELANGTYLPPGSKAFICPKSQRMYQYPGAGGTWQLSGDKVSALCDGNHLGRQGSGQVIVLYNDGRVVVCDPTEVVVIPEQ